MLTNLFSSSRGHAFDMCFHSTISSKLLITEKVISAYTVEPQTCF